MRSRVNAAVESREAIRNGNLSFVSYTFYLQFFACVLALWGVVMVVNRILGIIRRLRE